MEWIENDKIIVLNQPPKLIENALTYVKFATREKRRGLKAWDSAHLYHAYYWARSLDSQVFLVTTDDIILRMLVDYREYSKYVLGLDPYLRVTYYPFIT